MSLLSFWAHGSPFPQISDGNEKENVLTGRSVILGGALGQDIESRPRVHHNLRRNLKQSFITSDDLF